MNKRSWFVLLFITCKICNAQVFTEKVFYDAAGNKTDSAKDVRYSIYYYDDFSKISGTCKAYSSQGILTSEGYYSNIEKGNLAGNYKYYYDTGELKYTCNYVDSGMDGELISYYRDGTIKRKDYYKENKFIRGNCYTAKGEDTAHFEFEIMPQFPGGEKALLKYLAKKIKYPWSARASNIYGEVVISFIINKTGDVEDIVIKKSVHPILDNEAIRVIKKMPKWTPGFQDGEPVYVQYNLPIRFKFR